MLTERTRNALSILRQAGGYGSSEANMNVDERATISELLKNGGMLDQQGNLTRPLYDISIYELLLILHEGVLPVDQDRVEEDIYKKYHQAARRLGVMNSLMEEWLSKVKLSEL